MSEASATNYQENIYQVPLCDLEISKINMRQRSPKDEDAHERLKANIKSVGVLQSLIVHPVAKKLNTYAVAGGGRRFRALTELAKEKVIDPKTYLVSCRVMTEEEALSATIAENYHRLPPHPVDECTAFKKLSEVDGMTLKQIAEDFGVGVQYVRQRLALAKVHPKILDKFIKGDISLAAVAAFTIEPDTKKQLAVSKKLESWEWRDHIIRDALTSEISTRHWKVKLVTLEKYKEAGGAVSDDLFEDDQRIMDAELLDRLYQEYVDDKIEKLNAEGWGFVEVTSEYFFDWEYGKLEGTGKGGRITKADKPNGGVIIESRPGCFEIHRGLTKSKPKKTTSSTNTSSAPKEKYSQAFRDDIGHTRQEAFKIELFKQPELCRLVLDFALCDKTFNHNPWAHTVSISTDRIKTPGSNVFDELTPVQSALLAIQSSLDLSWCAADDIVERFQLFRKLDLAERVGQVNAVTVFSLQCSYRRPDRQTLADVLIDELGIDFTKHWTPTAENFFKRVSVPVMKEALQDIYPDDYPAETNKMKKGQLAEFLAREWEVELDEMPKWLPEGF
jgi:ParB/RepB/Spo0J family partition protein